MDCCMSFILLKHTMSNRGWWFYLLLGFSLYYIGNIFYSLIIHKNQNNFYIIHFMVISGYLFLIFQNMIFENDYIFSCLVGIPREIVLCESAIWNKKWIAIKYISWERWMCLSLFRITVVTHFFCQSFFTASILQPECFQLLWENYFPVETCHIYWVLREGVHHFSTIQRTHNFSLVIYKQSGVLQH